MAKRVTGRVRGGVVILPDDAVIADGTDVVVEPIETVTSASAKGSTGALLACTARWAGSSNELTAFPRRIAAFPTVGDRYATGRRRDSCRADSRSRMRRPGITVPFHRGVVFTHLLNFVEQRALRCHVQRSANCGTWSITVSKLIRIESVCVSSLQAAELEFDSAAAEEFGIIRAELRRIGRPIPAIDTQIAAIARRNELTVLSADRHFLSVPGLSVENWLQ